MSDEIGKYCTRQHDTGKIIDFLLVSDLDSDTTKPPHVAMMGFFPGLIINFCSREIEMKNGSYRAY